MDERIYKNINNGNFYIIAFLTTFLCFIGFQVLLIRIGISVVEINQPGFRDAFSQAFLNPELMTNTMYMIQNVAQFAGNFILAIIMIILLRKEFKRNFISFKKELGYNILSIFLGFFIMSILNVSLVLLYDSLQIYSQPDNQNSIMQAIRSSSGVLMILAVVLLAPFVEEILFRKLLYGVIQEKFNLSAIFAILISAVIFSALHAVDIFFFQYFVMAIVLCGSYALFKNNIFVPIGIHFLNNSMVFFLAIGIFN